MSNFYDKFFMKKEFLLMFRDDIKSWSCKEWYIEQVHKMKNLAL